MALTPASDLQAAFNAAPEGTTFCLGAGVYRLGMAVVPKNRQVIWGAPGTVLNGSRLVIGFERSGGRFLVRGQTQEFLPVSDGPCADETYSGCHRPAAVFSDDSPLWEVTSLVALRPGTFFFDSGADTIYLADDPTGHKVEVAVAPAALVGYRDFQHDVSVRGLVIEKFAATSDRAQYGAVKAGFNWLVENNEIRLNSSAAVQVASGTVLRNNFLHHNGQYGFRNEPLTGLTVEGNDIGFNNTSGFSPNWDAGGSKVLLSTQMTFRANRVHDNFGPGLWTDTDNRFVLYEGNTLERNEGPGIFHEASADATIRDNVFRNNGAYARGKSLWYSADLFLHDSKNTEIYGNTIDAGVNGIGLVDTDRGSTPMGLLEIRNVSVHDNTIKMPPGGVTGLIGTRAAAFNNAGNRFERNTYTVTDLTSRSWAWNTPRTRGEWQALGQDVNGAFLPPS